MKDYEEFSRLWKTILDNLKKLFPTKDNSQPRITNLEKVLTKEQVVNVHKVESKISKEKDKEHSTFKSIKESVDYIIKQWGNKKESQITEKDYNEYIKVRNKFFKDFEKVFGIVANDRNILRILGENINKSLFLISFVFSRYEAIRKTKDTIFDFPLGKKIYRAFYDDRKEINLSKEDVDIIINNKIIKEQLKNQILYKFGFDVKAEVEFNLKNINTNLYKFLDLIYCQANFQNIKTAGISDNEVYLTGKLLVRLDRHLVWNDYKGKIPDDLFKQIPEKRELFLKFIYDNQETVPVKLDRISSLKRRTINVKEIPSKQRSLFGTVIYRDELGREHMECETGLGFVSLSPGMQKLAGAVVFYTSSTIRVAGGSVEIVCGIVMIAGTKGLATVGGVILIANGTDNVVAGVRSIWSGQYKEAFLEQGVKYGVKQMGGSELAGDIAYMGTQIIIPVSATALAKLDKAGKLIKFFKSAQNKYIPKIANQADDIASEIAVNTGKNIDDMIKLNNDILSNKVTPQNWKPLLGGKRIVQVGNYWVKEVNPNASKLAQLWAKGDIKAQAIAMKKLRDMAPDFIFDNGRLIVQDVGEFSGTRLDAFKLYIKGSWRLKTPMNDIVNRNIGAGGKVFDPALHPVARGIYWVGFGSVSIAGYKTGGNLYIKIESIFDKAKKISKGVIKK